MDDSPQSKPQNSISNFDESKIHHPKSNTDGSRFDRPRNTLQKSPLEQENERLQQALRSAREQLVRLETEVRAQIGRDLHDGPVQQVAAAGLHISYLRRVMERAPRMLGQAIDDLDDQLANAMHSLRTVLLELRPVGMDEHGLYWVLEQYAKKYPTPDGLELHLDIPDDLPRMAPTQEMPVFFIIQEALMNTRKHAEARHATIAIHLAGRVMRVTISDNGKGFDVDEVSRRQLTQGSLGMSTMRERAERIGATVRVDAVPGAGTTVTIDVPYSALPPA